jgi:Domain of unknown function (DUF4276)
MVKITIFVEGGGDTRNQQGNCRKGFREFFNKLEIKSALTIIACGSRKNAYDSFCIGLKNNKNNEYCLLLVDSEAPVNNPSVWQHVLLQENDKWQRPDKATEDHLHFMVECMEAWFMADKQALVSYYGKNFKQNALPQNTTIEAISKSDLYDGLKTATRDTTKGIYSKNGHSFEILSKIDAHKVIEKSLHAKKLHVRLLTLINPTS